MLRLLGCVNSIMFPDDISEISIIKHRSNLLPRYFRLRADALRRDEMPPHIRGLQARLANAREGVSRSNIIFCEPLASLTYKSPEGDKSISRSV